MPVQQLFLPHQQSGTRAHAISPLAFTLYIAFVLVSIISFQILAKEAGLVLGYATDIHEQEIVSLTNQQRRAEGLNELTYSEELAKAAQLKAESMFTLDYWAHIAPNGTTPWVFIEQAGYDFYAAGENLARDFNDSESVVKAWMKSPSHAENILGSLYADIGVAVVNGELAGSETTLVVQMFGITRGSTVAPPSPQPPVQVSPEAVSVNVGENPAALEAEIPAPVEITEPALAVEPVQTGYQLGEATKAISLGFAFFLLILFVLDLLLITKKGIVRVSGNTLAHVSMLLFIIGALWWINGGSVL